MKDPILQEVRDARAAVAADFDFDLHKFFAWAKTHAAAEQKARLPTDPNPSSETTDVEAKSPAARKRRVHPAPAGVVPV